MGIRVLKKCKCKNETKQYIHFIRGVHDEENPSTAMTRWQKKKRWNRLIANEANGFEILMYFISRSDLEDGEEIVVSSFSQASSLI